MVTPAWLPLALICAAPLVAMAQVRDDGKDVICSRAGQEVMRYRHGDGVIKPYVEQLRTPGGVNVLRDSPSDHKHHHGLMFAVAVDGVNFWEEREAFGREVGREPIAIIRGNNDGLHREPGKGSSDALASCDGIKEKIDWIGPTDAKPLLVENRVVVVHRVVASNVTLATWQSRLTLPSGKASAKITGDTYFGLGMRFVESMDKVGRFLNADGKTSVEDTNAARSKWCAYSAVADGKPVTVAMFDHPYNFRHPATWFTMTKPFAYLCATLDLKNEPFEMSAGKPLLLRYGVALWDGSPDPREIERLYKRWAGLPALGDEAQASKPAK